MPTKTDEQKFLEFLNRDESPCDYERQLLSQHYARIKAILEHKIVPPYEVEIQPTSLCNLRCQHCWGKSYKRLPNKMGTKEMDTLARRVGAFVENGFGIETVKFCGTTGEPLVNPVTLYGIDLFKDIGKKVIVFTNGLNLDMLSEGVPYYKRLLKADKINLSLDAGSEFIFRKLKGREGFGRIMDNTGKIIESRNNKTPQLVVSYVVGKENYTDILEATLLAKSIGVDEIRFRVDFTDTKTIKELSDVIIKSIEESRGRYEDNSFKVDSVYSDTEIRRGEYVSSTHGIKCFNHHFWACIGPNCELYACGHRTHGGVESYGDLLRYSFKELWTNKKRQDSLCTLPDISCQICSPSSKRRNYLMDFLSHINHKDLDMLISRYVLETKKQEGYFHSACPN